MARLRSEAYRRQRQVLREYLLGVIAENCRRYRTQLGITQREVSEMFFAGESYYRSVEAGTRELSLVRLAEIAEALGVRPADLLEGAK